MELSEPLGRSEEDAGVSLVLRDPLSEDIDLAGLPIRRDPEVVFGAKWLWGAKVVYIYIHIYIYVFYFIVILGLPPVFAQSWAQERAQRPRLEKRYINQRKLARGVDSRASHN